MRQLALKFHADFRIDHASVVGEIETPSATPMSVVRELVTDSAGFATALLDLQVRLLKTRNVAIDPAILISPTHKPRH